MTEDQWQLSGSPGEIYERYMVPAIFARWAEELVALAAPQPGERVLDVACGTGVVTRLVAGRLGSSGTVVGLDVNPGMLEAARSASPGATIDWREGSALELPFPDASFDIALCEQGLQFFPNRQVALREMHRVLAPGGRAVLSVWRSTRDCPGFRAIEQALARHVGPEAAALPPFSLGDADELRGLIAGAGFRETAIRADVKMTRFPSPELFVRCVVAGAPTMLGPLAEQGEAGLVNVVEDVASTLRSYMDDDGLAFPQANHIAHARK